jgi:hypothetical protein
VTIDMTRQRGYRSALYACPEPAAAFAVPPVEARLRHAGVDVRPQLDAVLAPTQGTGLPAAAAAQGTAVPAGRIASDVLSITLVQFVQPHPGDRARRHTD